MTYLSDTARVVLAAAAQRADLSVLPFPDECKAKGGAEQKVLAGCQSARNGDPGSACKRDPCEDEVEGAGVVDAEP
jgi:hypothetical protein